MLGILLALFLQEATAEARLEALEAKLLALERRQEALSDENARLEARAEVRARQSAAAWVKRHAAASFSQEQAVELEALWAGWLKQGAAHPEAWKAREEDLRARLHPRQREILERAVREDREKSARTQVTALLRAAKVPAERAAAFASAALALLPEPDGALIFRGGLAPVRAAVEAALEDPGAALTDEEKTALREALARSKD